MARMLLFSGFSPGFLARMEASAVNQIVDDLVVNNNWDGPTESATVESPDQIARSVLDFVTGDAGNLKRERYRSLPSCS
jgi:hypothetical protein